MNIIMATLLLRIKNFVHRHEILETAGLICLGVITIVRTFFIFRAIRHSPPKKKYKVILLTIRTFPNPGLPHFEAVFFHAFRALGVNAKMLFHDGILTSTDAATYYRSEKPQNLVSALLGKFFQFSLAADAISYRNFISKKEIQEIEKKVATLLPEDLEPYTFKEVKVGLHAKASAIRYFLTGKIDLRNPDHVEIFRQKLVSAIIAAEVANRLVAKEKPDLIFTVHGVYSTWGPFYEYFRYKGIDTVVYNLSAYRFGHFIFNRNSIQDEIVSKKAWEHFSRLPLSQREEHAVRYYFKKRISGEIGEQKMFTLYFNTAIQKDILLKKLLEGGHERQYILYPNLAWDEILAGGRISKSFRDMFEWIDATIEFFKNKGEYRLIVKPHPAERIWEKGTKGIAQYIHKKHDPLPENITVLEPDVPISAYDLITPRMIGLTFCGSLGLELPCMGIPAIAVAQKMHYGQAGIVYPIKTAKEYFALLQNPEDLISFTKKNLAKTKKYAYFYYFKSLIWIPFYREDAWSTLDWSVMRDMDKLLSGDSPIIKICKKLMQKEDIVAPL
ncbi:MAG: hypothetical protein HY001_02760 [Candidatus Portnoybacteria bacterium]|nr:hypothetical protein [Candidatus Portnoybacteria bacterium]